MHNDVMTSTKRPSTVAEFFKAVRATREITQAELADLAGCSPMYIGHLEQGKYKSPIETIKKLRPTLTKKEKDLIREILVNQLVEELEG
ncbi:helix-turn-helix protein [compost metagenome]